MRQPSPPCEHHTAMATSHTLSPLNPESVCLTSDGLAWLVLWRWNPLRPHPTAPTGTVQELCLLSPLLLHTQAPGVGVVPSLTRSFQCVCPSFLWGVPFTQGAIAVGFQVTDESGGPARPVSESGWPGPCGHLWGVQVRWEAHLAAKMGSMQGGDPAGACGPAVSMARTSCPSPGSSGWAGSATLCHPRGTWPGTRAPAGSEVL